MEKRLVQSYPKTEFVTQTRTWVEAAWEAAADWAAVGAETEEEACSAGRRLRQLNDKDALAGAMAAANLGGGGGDGGLGGEGGARGLNTLTATTPEQWLAAEVADQQVMRSVKVPARE